METIRYSQSRVLTEADTKQHLVHRVPVPADTRALEIALHFEPHRVDGFHNMLTLTILGPDGFRGAGHRHGHDHIVNLSAAAATPGYLAGPITPGNWQVVIDTHMVMPGTPCRYELEVVGLDEAPAADLRPASPRRPARALRGAGWYRGDLHAHTLHSDATWTAGDLAAFARSRGLDFVTLSDHNTTAGLDEMAAACGDDLVLMPAQELTTFWGHALALGAAQWIDWRTSPAQRTMIAVAADVEACGGLFVIAHPRSIGDPYCTGCAWTHPDMQPGSARLVEVWNSEWHSESHNELALAQAYSWLNSGYRMVLTAGTDHHGQIPGNSPLGFDVVRADTLTPAGLLNAIRQGHLYLSAGPSLQFEVLVNSDRHLMGDSLRPAPGTAIQLIARWNGCPADARIELTIDGAPVGGRVAGPEGEQVWGQTAGEASWCLVSLRAANGTLLALTNPIFLDGR